MMRKKAKEYKYWRVSMDSKYILLLKIAWINLMKSG